MAEWNETCSKRIGYPYKVSAFSSMLAVQLALDFEDYDE